MITSVQNATAKSRANPNSLWARLKKDTQKELWSLSDDPSCDHFLYYFLLQTQCTVLLLHLKTFSPERESLEVHGSDLNTSSFSFLLITLADSSKIH